MIAGKELIVVECPRDAMQGFKHPIRTETKVLYLRKLLKVGFRILDCGSFVSASSVPQMADTHEVLDTIKGEYPETKRLVIVGNLKGAKLACEKDYVDVLGFPFSFSSEFQKRNINKSVEESFEIYKKVLSLSQNSGKDNVVYISMAFGNPYNEPWSVEMVYDWCGKLIDAGAQVISLSDTTAVSNKNAVHSVFSNLIKKYPAVTFGAHFHTRPDNWFDMIDEAYNSGCRRFDGAIKGYGGCQFANDKLTGNLPTENILSYMQSKNEPLGIDMNAFQQAVDFAVESVFI